MNSEIKNSNAGLHDSLFPPKSPVVDSIAEVIIEWKLHLMVITEKNPSHKIDGKKTGVDFMKIKKGLLLQSNRGVCPKFI